MTVDPGSLTAGSPDCFFNECEQLSITEGKIKQFETVHECNRLEDDQRFFSRSFTAVIYRYYRHGIIFPYGNIPIPRLIPEFPDNILRYHALMLLYPV
ncbi:MAG: hypothetical protein LUQ04_09485 [Methanoregula sp.]|nr:hypothetical protein [Methanoregula sp.]